MNYIPTKTSVAKAGDIYGRLTILGIYKLPDGYPKYALTQCSCGTAPRYVALKTIRSGESRSCGCLHKEAVTKHNRWKDPLYHVWRGMMSRCNNPKDKSYKHYGARGIKVCDDWHQLDSFIADMSPSFSKGLTLDRINVEGNYELFNCRWATHREQNRNYRRNVILEYNGLKMCLADWAIKLDINYGTLWSRLDEGWTVDRALTTPPKSLPMR